MSCLKFIEELMHGQQFHIINHHRYYLFARYYGCLFWQFIRAAKMAAEIVGRSHQRAAD
jgi:hypothetical protein